MIASYDVEFGFAQDRVEEAVAGTYAEGGVALAPHANDPAAADFFLHALFFRISQGVVRWSWLFLALPLFLVAASRRGSAPPR